MFSEYPDVLTVTETCEALRIGNNAIYGLLNSGEIKAYRNGRTWRIPKQSLIDYICAQSKLTSSSHTSRF